MIIFITITLAVLRAFITPRLSTVPSWEGAYEAFAHLFCGALIGIRLYDWKGYEGPTRLYWYLGWSLAFWELGWFLCQKYL